MKLSKENYYKTVDEYAVRFMEGSDRSHVFEELVQKGIDKKEASMICDLAQRTAIRNQSIKKNKNNLLFRGIICILLGVLLSAFAFIVIERMESTGYIIISRVSILIYLSKYIGVILFLMGITMIIIDIINRRKEKKSDNSSILDS